MKFKDYLIEKVEKHAVLAFGRMNPITTGHQKLVDTVKSIAKKVGGSHHIILSHSQDAKKNPLTATQKVRHAQRAFPGTNFSASDHTAPNFLAQAAKLHQSGVSHLHMVGGSDRVQEFHNLLHKYNGTHKGALFNFKGIKVHSAGERDPDAEGTTGISASKMREHATKGNFDEFKKGAPSTMAHAHVKQMYNDVRRGMGLREDINLELEYFLIEGVHDKSIFKAVFLAGGPGSGKDYVLSNTLDGHGLVEINSDKALEFLMDKKGLDKRMPESEKEVRNIVRDRAKDITELKQRFALQGRNGLIINGTGDDPEKVGRIKKALEDLGYETSMVLVNTNDEVSAARNIERGQRGGRTVPETIRKEKWDSVQNARTEYAKMFADRYMEFDNSEDLREVDPDTVKQKKMEMLQIFKNVQQFTSQPPQSPQAQEWIANEMERADKTVSKKSIPLKAAPSDSASSSEARGMGLEYYGFGRYGKDGHVTHRSVNDTLVAVTQKEPEQKKIPVSASSSGTKVKKESLDVEFEEMFSEDLRNWFSKSHSKGDWVRMSSTGEIKGQCAREPGEAKPKCLPRSKAHSLSKQDRASAVRAKRRADPDADRKGKPINVDLPSEKKNIKESFDLSDSSALNLLLLGNTVDEHDLPLGEAKEPKLLKDKTGRVRVFMIRAAAAREAHQTGGKVLTYKNGYVIQLKENEDEYFQRDQKTIGTWIKEARATSSIDTRTESRRGLISEGVTELIPGAEYARGSGVELSNESRPKITLTQVRKKKNVQEETSRQIDEIDRGIEPGLSMAAGGENFSRKATKTKAVKKPFEEAIGAGGEDVSSRSDHEELELKRQGINLQSFKAKRPIG
jgi:predicted ABC-type ATPase